MLDAPTGGDANDAAEDEDDDAPLQIEDMKNAQNGTNGGLLGASTLAALQGFKANAGGEKKAPDKAAGPLIGYGSDSDDD